MQTARPAFKFRVTPEKKDQCLYVNPNWIKRAGTAVSVICPNVDAVPMSTADGNRNIGWFQTLNISMRAWNWWLSFTWKLLITEKSQFCWNGPRKTLRGELPK